jgi:hypothetical protein
MLQIYLLIYKNKKIIDEIKIVLKQFPESLLIHTEAENVKTENLEFVNDMFKTKIALHSDNDIDETNELNLSQVPISIESNLESNLNDTMTMKDFISADKENGNLMISVDTSHINEEEDKNHNLTTKNENETKRIFQVKILRVSWNMKHNSYLEVFVDTKDLMRLEEEKERNSVTENYVCNSFS